MVSLLKTFGKGILYVLGFPFFVLALVLFGVVGLFLFAFQLIKSVFYFFTGRKFFPELQEDKELRLLKEKAAEAKEEAETKSENSLFEDTSFNEVTFQPISDNQSIFTPISNEPLFDDEENDPIPQPELEQEQVKKAVFISDDDVDDDFPLKPFGSAPEVEAEEEMMEEEQGLEELIFREEPKEEIPEPAPMEPLEREEETIDITEPKEEEEPQEELEEYVPEGSSYTDDIEEDDTNSGVFIDYDL